MATKAAREITVLNRYEIKEDYAPKGLHKGDVVLHIRNDKGVEYYTTLRRNKCHSCTCPSKKPCYHIKDMAVKENARHEAATVAKVEVAKAIKEVEKSVDWKATLLADKARKARMADERFSKATLNGNRGFSLMK